MSINVDELILNLQYLQKNSVSGYAQFPNGKNNAIVLFSPELISTVLTNSPDINRGISFIKMKNFFGNGLIVSENPDHIKNKRIIQKDFSKTSMENYVEIVYHTAQEIIDSFSGEISLIEQSDLFAFNCVAESFLGKRVPKKYIPIYHEISEKSTNLPYLAFTEDDKKNFFILKNFVQNFVSAGSKKNNLLGHLLASEMDEDQVVDEIITVLGAGFETTSALIAWSILHMSNNKSFIDRIRNEVPAWITEKRIPSYEEVFASETINNIINETLRTTPPAYFTTRMAAKDIELKELKINAGTNIFISQYVCHRNEQYFSDPDKWNPDRWSNTLEKQLPKGVYFPFGIGSKKCVGEHFAKLMATMFLLILINKKEFNVINQNVSPKYLVSMIPDNPVKMFVQDIDRQSQLG